MVVLVEQRDGLVSCGHPFDRVVRIEWRLAGKHRARDRQQAIADTAQSAAVAVTAFAQFGVAMSAALVMLRGDARPVIDSAAQPHMAGLAPDDDAVLAAAPGHRSDPGQGPQGVIVSPTQRLASLSEQRGENDPSDARQGSQDSHVALLGLLPRGVAVSLIFGNPVGKRVKTLVRLLDLPVH